jgi:hypothetical protein
MTEFFLRSGTFDIIYGSVVVLIEILVLERVGLAGPANVLGE